MIDYREVDYEQNLEQGKSTIRYVFTLEDVCLCKLATIVEYVALAKYTNESIWFEKLIMKVRLKQYIVSLHCDSQSVIHLAFNQIIDSKVKHIDIQYHFVLLVL